MERRSEATIPMDDWCGAHRAFGAIAGKPGAWRNRSNRCRHHVERSVTRCFYCDPLLPGEDPLPPPAAQERPRSDRLYSIEERLRVLRALTTAPMRLAEIEASVGLSHEAMRQMSQALRAGYYVKVITYDTLVISERGMDVVRRNWGKP